MESSDTNNTSVTVTKCRSDLCEIRVYETEVIVVPVLLVAVSLIVGSCILRQICRKKRETQREPNPRTARGGGQTIPMDDRDVPPFPRRSVSDPTPLPQIPRDRIDGEMVKICEGRYGPIYRSYLLSDSGTRGKEIAVKSLRVDAGSREEAEFVATMRFLRFVGPHGNVADFLGCSPDEPPLYFCQSYMRCRELLSFLWECRKDVIKMEGVVYDLTEKQVYKLAADVARGLVFLHGKGIIHGNVAARNVLLSDALEARISGFQTARRILGFGAPEPLHVLPRKWSSPEILTRQTLTPKTDVWSFGILLYELITLGSPPYPDVLCNDILQFLQRGNIQSRPGNCRTHLYGLMRESWRWREGSRPSMAAMLSGLVEGGAEADDRNVLRVPELIDPQSYALTTGINPSSDLTAL